jgi:hypothetical protein
MPALLIMAEAARVLSYHLEQAMDVIIWGDDTG